MARGLALLQRTWQVFLCSSTNHVDRTRSSFCKERVYYPRRRVVIVGGTLQLQRYHVHPFIHALIIKSMRAVLQSLIRCGISSNLTLLMGKSILQIPVPCFSKDKLEASYEYVVGVLCYPGFWLAHVICPSAINSRGEKGIREKIFLSLSMCVQRLEITRQNVTLKESVSLQVFAALNGTSQDLPTQMGCLETALTFNLGRMSCFLDLRDLFSK